MSEIEATRDNPQENIFQTGKVATIAASHLSHDVFSAFLAPLLPLLIAKLGLSLSAVALLDITRKIPQLLNPFIGLLADRICVKYLVIFAPVVTAICMSLLGLAPSFPVLAILLFVSGLSAAVFHVPGPVLIKRYSGSNSGRGMSFYMFGGEMARTLGPLLITAAVSWWGLEGSYRVLPLGLAASVVLFFKLRNLQRVEPDQPRSLWSGSRKAFMDMAPLFLGLAGFMVFRMGLKSALTLYLPTYLTGMGKTIWVAGLALSLLQFSGAAGTLGAGYFADRFGHRKSLLIISLMTPIAGMGLTFFPGVLTVPLLIITGFLLFASSPIQLALVQDSGTSRPAFLNSLFMTLNILSSALAVFFVGNLGDRVGLDLTYKIAAGLTVLAIPFILFFPKDQK